MCLELCEKASTLNEFMPLINVAAGALIGGAISFFSSTSLENRRHKQESRRIALAFKGEVGAILSIIKRRRYLDGFEAAIRHMEEKREKYPILIYVRRDYFKVFDSNVGNLGLIACPLPQLIPQFYVYANSLLEDLQSHREGIYDDYEAPQLTDHVKELHSMLSDIVTIGDEIIKQTDLLYR
jgi:hypothetical protein